MYKPPSPRRAIAYADGILIHIIIQCNDDFCPSQINYVTSAPSFLSLAGKWYNKNGHVFWPGCAGPAAGKRTSLLRTSPEAVRSVPWPPSGSSQPTRPRCRHQQQRQEVNDEFQSSAADFNCFDEFLMAKVVPLIKVHLKTWATQKIPLHMTLSHNNVKIAHT